MRKKLSIGIVTPTISRAGGGIFPIVQAHAKYLSKAGIDITVYGVDDDPNGLDTASWAGVHLRKYNRTQLGYIPKLAKDLALSEHDLLHQHGLWTHISLITKAWGSTFGRPTVISTQGMLEPWALRNSAFKKRLALKFFEQANLNAASAIHCSPAETSGVKAIVPNAKVATIENGIDLPVLDPSDTSAHTEQRGRKTLLFLGRVHPKKGIAELITAFSTLRRQEADITHKWKLIIAGWDDGGHLDTLKQLSDRLGFGKDELEFVGPAFGDKKENLLRHADAFILPSYSEGFPMAILEAWSYSIPVLMTDGCNIPEGFNFGCALRIDTDSNLLATQIEQYLSQSDLAEIGANGRRYAEEHLSWPKISENLVELYNTITC